MLQRFEAPDSDTESSGHVTKRRRKDQSSGSDSSSYSSSSGSDSSDPDEEAKRSFNPAGLLISQLVAMNEGQSEADDSVYAKQAQDPKRIKAVLKEPCCKRSCKRNLPWKLVLRMVTFFWTLPKVSQDSTLWAIQQRHHDDEFDSSSDSENSENSSSDGKRHKISWSIEGGVMKTSKLTAGRRTTCRSSSLQAKLSQTAWNQRLTTGEDPERFQRG